MGITTHSSNFSRIYFLFQVGWGENGVKDAYMRKILNLEVEGEHASVFWSHEKHMRKMFTNYTPL
jgi:hypothetical protein